MTNVDSHTEHDAYEAVAGRERSSQSIDRLFVKAEEALTALAGSSDATAHDSRRFEFHDFAGVPNLSEPASLAGGDQEVAVTIELGRTRVGVKDLDQLGAGSVVPLDKLVDEPVDILVNGHVAARGEVIVIESCFCVRVTELVSGFAAQQ